MSSELERLIHKKVRLHHLIDLSWLLMAWQMGDMGREDLQVRYDIYFEEEKANLKPEDYALAARLEAESA